METVTLEINGFIVEYGVLLKATVPPLSEVLDMLGQQATLRDRLRGTNKFDHVDPDPDPDPNYAHAQLEEGFTTDNVGKKLTLIGPMTILRKDGEVEMVTDEAGRIISTLTDGCWTKKSGITLNLIGRFGSIGLRDFFRLGPVGFSVLATAAFEQQRTDVLVEMGLAELFGIEPFEVDGKLKCAYGVLGAADLQVHLRLYEDYSDLRYPGFLIRITG